MYCLDAGLLLPLARLGSVQMEVWVEAELRSE
jgi:hypothetical protein